MAARPPAPAALPWWRPASSGWSPANAAIARRPPRGTCVRSAWLAHRSATWTGCSLGTIPVRSRGVARARRCVAGGAVDDLVNLVGQRDGRRVPSERRRLRRLRRVGRRAGAASWASSAGCRHAGRSRVGQALQIRHLRSSAGSRRSGAAGSSASSGSSAIGVVLACAGGPAALRAARRRRRGVSAASMRSACPIRPVAWDEVARCHWASRSCLPVFCRNDLHKPRIRLPLRTDHEPAQDKIGCRCHLDPFGVRILSQMRAGARLGG